MTHESPSTPRDLATNTIASRIRTLNLQPTDPESCSGTTLTTQLQGCSLLSELSEPAANPWTWAGTTLLLLSTTAIAMSFDVSIGSDVLYAGVLLSAAWHALRAHLHNQAVSDVLGGQIAFTTSALTAVMPLATNENSPLLSTLMGFSFIANLILYGIDVPPMLRQLPRLVTQGSDTISWSKAVPQQVITSLLAISGAYLITADMFDGARSLVDQKIDANGQPLLHFISHDPKWVTTVLLPTFIASFAFTRKGLQKCAEACLSAWQTCRATPPATTAAAMEDDRSDTESASREPESEIAQSSAELSSHLLAQGAPSYGSPSSTSGAQSQPPAKNTSKAIILVIISAAVSACSQEGLVSSLIKAAKDLPVPLIQDGIKQFSYGFYLVATAARTLVASPKLYHVLNTLSSPRCDANTSTRCPSMDFKTIQTDRLSLSAWNEVENALQDACETHTRDDSTTQNRTQYPQLRAELVKKLQDELTTQPGCTSHNTYAACTYYLKQLFKRIVSPIAVLANGGANVYLCETLLPGILNGLVSIGINGSALSEWLNQPTVAEQINAMDDGPAATLVI